MKRPPPLTAGARRPALALLFLLSGLAPGACQGPEPTGHARRALEAPPLLWQAALDSPALDVAPRADGALLASTRRAVYLVSAEGKPKPIFELGDKPPAERAILNPAGSGFAVAGGERLVLHDALGPALYEAKAGPRDAVRLVPGESAFVDPIVEGDDPERGEVRKARIADGGDEATFEAPGLVATRLTAEHIYYRTRSELVKLDRGGKKLWSTPVAARMFEPDAAVRWLIVARDDDARNVTLYEDDHPAGDAKLAGPAWNVAMAPGGKLAAASAKGQLAIFVEGKLSALAQLGDGRPVALAASDRGHVLVGYQDAKAQRASVRCFDTKGAERWQIEVPYGTQAYRPAPRFFPDGGGFVVRHEAGLSAYRIEEGG